MVPVPGTVGLRVLIVLLTEFRGRRFVAPLTVLLLSPPHRQARNYR
jgi:hypothetical protein